MKDWWTGKRQQQTDRSRTCTDDAATETDGHGFAEKCLMKSKFLLSISCLVFVFGLVGSVLAKTTERDETPADLETEAIHRMLPSVDSIQSSLSFINDSLCLIQDPSHSMSAFIDGLNELLNGKDTVINIIHLGDSHIQAGYLSGRTMRLMQSAFGNAGRGWIAPFKLSKVNEPSDYFISSNVKEWIAGRCVQLNPKCPWGIGGIGIQTEAKDIDFNLIIAPNNGAGYSFNKVLMYRDHHAPPMIPALADKDTTHVLSWGNQPFQNILIDTFATANLVDTLTFKSLQAHRDSMAAKYPGANRYYGFMLTNSNPGILYHSIGVNGAKFVDYTSREYVRQLSLLNPSLLIVSLGTNESFGRNFSKATFEQQVDSFIRLVREELPETTLLITTPAETYKRVYKNKKRHYVRNENISKIAETISSYAEKENIAYWDLYTLSGGYNSCKNWFDAKMFGRDRIHFSRDGYDEQGVLLYKAIIRSCVQHSTEEEIINAMKASEEEARHVE